MQQEITKLRRVFPLSLAFALLVPSIGNAQILKIIDATGDGAGNMLDGSGHVVVDCSGNVYLTGGDSNNAFKITPDGVVCLFIDAAGDGFGHTLSGANGIAVDRWGNVYVAGDESDNGFKIEGPCGANIITEIINATGDSAGNTLDGTIDMAVDGSGNIYVTGDNTHNLFMIEDPCGAKIITEIINATGDGAGHTLQTTLFIAVDGSGNVYVTGGGSNNVFKIEDPGGANTITEIIDGTGDGLGNMLDNPEGIAVDGSGNVYVAGFKSDNVFKIEDPGGANTITEIIDATGDGCGNRLDGALMVAVDGAGNVYVTGFESDNAFKIEDPCGAKSIIEIIDATGDGAGNVLDGATGIAVGGTGIVFVAGHASDNAFKISLDCGLVYCGFSQNPNNAANISIDTCESSGASINISLSNGPAGKFAYLLVGDGTSTVSQPPGANGDLCVAGGSCLGRYAKDVGQIDAAGTFSTDIKNAVSNPCAGGVNIIPGATWNFQYWHRQPMGQPATFTEAISVTFE